MLKKLTLLVTLLALTSIAGAFPFSSDEDKNKAQIDLFMTLGLLKYGNHVDASGSRDLLVLYKDNTGVFTHQYVHESEGKNFEKVLEARGLIQQRLNKDTGKVEKMIMVFNPKDKDTYVWVPLAKARETAQRIKDTGKTLPIEKGEQRVKDKDLNSFDMTTSF